MMRESWTATLCVCLTTTLIIHSPVVPGQQAEKQIRFTGKVIDAGGQRIEGARVRLFVLTYGGIPYSGEVTPAGDTTTGADGAVSFAAPAESESYRHGYVVAEKEGLAIGFASWDMEQDQQRDITLGEAKPLVGTVVDESGAPIPDAAVSIYLLQMNHRGQEYGLGMHVAPRLLTTHTDSGGRFAFTNLPGGATGELLVRKPGRATVCTFNPLARTYAGAPMRYAVGQTDIRLTQPVEARIEGIVTQKNTSQPVPGVKLAVACANNRLLDGHEMVRAESDGTFTVPALPAGEYTLQLAWRSGESPDWVAAPVPVTLETGQVETGVRIAAVKGGLLEAAVTEAAGQKPVEKASVSIRDQRDSRWFSGSSDAEGIARMRLMPGTYQMQGVYKQGYTYDGRPQDITIEEGVTKRMAVTLKETPKIRGVVRDPDGVPVAGARIRVLPVGREDVTSDAEGRFEAAWERRGWDEEGTIFCLLARHVGRNLAAAVEISESIEALDVNLEAGVTLTGRVVDPNGRGIAGARIRPMMNLSDWGSPLSRNPMEADGNGSFEIRAVPAGHRYSVDAYADGYGSQDRRVESMNAVDGRLDVGTLKLPVANLSISGRIVDVEGHPVADATIEGYGEGQPSRCNTQADTEGNFTLEGVCGGRIHLQANTQQGRRRLSAHVVTDGGAENITIVVREGRSPIQYVSGKTYDQIIAGGGRLITGVAVDENDVPVAGVPVNVCCHKTTDENGRTSWHYSSFIGLSDTTDARGRFAIALEEDGEYNLRFSPDNLAALIVYDVPVGKRDLRVTLPIGGTIVGRLMRTEKGREVPIPHAEVKIEQTDRASYTHLGFDRDRTTTTDADGRFRFEHLNTRVRSDRAKEEYAPRVWQVSCGGASETIVFDAGMVIEDFELLVRPDPASAPPLTGNPVPGFDGIQIDLPADRIQGKRLLVCFFDMNQRPARHCVQQLARKAQELADKGVVIAAVQTADVDGDSLAAWAQKSGIEFPIGTVQTDIQEIKYTWAVRSLPWLILTDSRHVVRAEGFALSELDARIKEVGDAAR